MPFRSQHPDIVIPQTTLTNLVLGRADETFLRVLRDWPIELAKLVPPIAVLLAKHSLVAACDQSGVKWLFSDAAPSS